MIWFKELRYPLLLMGVLLHLSLEYSLNIPLFQWIILATYVNFIEPADLAKAWNWIRTRVTPRLSGHVQFAYDGGSERAARTANVLRAVDVLGRVQFVDLRPERQHRLVAEPGFSEASTSK